MNHHKRRYRDAIWQHRNRKWFIIGGDGDGAPVAIAPRADQMILKMLYREHRRRR